MATKTKWGDYYTNRKTADGRTWKYAMKGKDGKWYVANEYDKLLGAVKKGIREWERSEAERKRTQTKPQQPTQKRAQTPTERRAEQARRRQDYNNEARNYGLNSRDEVRAVQKFLLDNYGDRFSYLKNYAKGATGVDGYFGPSTQAAYTEAWKDPEIAAKLQNELKLQRPETHGPGTIKVGSKEVPWTDQNMRVANKVKAADEYVGEEFSPEHQFNMYTLGIPQALSITSNVGAVAKEMNQSGLGDAIDNMIFRGGSWDDVKNGWNNFSMSRMVDGYMKNNNQGAFELSQGLQDWANKNPQFSSLINFGIDILSPFAVKGLKAGRAKLAAKATPEAASLEVAPTKAPAGLIEMAPEAPIEIQPNAPKQLGYRTSMPMETSTRATGTTTQTPSQGRIGMTYPTAELWTPPVAPEPVPAGMRLSGPSSFLEAPKTGRSLVRTWGYDVAGELPGPSKFIEGPSFPARQGAAGATNVTTSGIQKGWRAPTWQELEMKSKAANNPDYTQRAFIKPNPEAGPVNNPDYTSKAFIKPNPEADIMGSQRLLGMRGNYPLTLRPRFDVALYKGIPSRLATTNPGFSMPTLTTPINYHYPQHLQGMSFNLPKYTFTLGGQYAPLHYNRTPDFNNPPENF